MLYNIIMPSSFFGNVMVTPIATLSNYSISSSTTTTTTVTVEKGSGTYTYIWTAPGCTITNGTTVTPTFTYTAAGTTNAYCTIRNNNTGISIISPTFVITWSAPITTTFTFTPSVNTSYVYNNTERTITYTTNPAEATASVTAGSLSVGPDVGSTSGTVTANGDYTGSATSPTITITRAPISATDVTPAAVTYNGNLRTAIVISNVVGTYTGSLSASGTNAGTYTSTITGIENYSGTYTGGNFVINRQSITAMSFRLNGTVFTTTQNRASGTTYTIDVGGTTPAAATKSPSSRAAFSTDGTYSLTSSGTGNYTGTFTSATVRVTTAVVSYSPVTLRSGTGSATLTTGVTPTAYAWSRVSGTNCSFTGATTSSPTITESGTTNSTTIVQCIISFSGGTSTDTYTIAWGVGA